MSLDTTAKDNTAAHTIVFNKTFGFGNPAVCVSASISSDSCFSRAVPEGSSPELSRVPTRRQGRLEPQDPALPKQGAALWVEREPPRECFWVRGLAWH